jgi:hypothetical protein
VGDEEQAHRGLVRQHQRQRQRGSERGERGSGCGVRCKVYGPRSRSRIRDVGVLGRAADYGGGASGSPGVKDDSNRLQISAAPLPVMAGEALVVRGATQDPGTIKISPPQLLALTLTPILPRLTGPPVGADILCHEATKRQF